MAQVLACATRSLKRGGVLWFACALAVLPMAPTQATEVVLHNFTPAPPGGRQIEVATHYPVTSR